MSLSLLRRMPRAPRARQRGFIGAVGPGLIAPVAAGGTPFDIRFGTNTGDTHTMSARLGTSASPTFASFSEPSPYEASFDGSTTIFTAIRVNIAAASLGASVTLTSATLNLRTTDSFISGTFSVYQCLREWNGAGGMSYNEWDTGQAWGTAGATNASDRGASPLGTQAFTDAQDNTDFAIALNTATMQTLVNAGGTLELLLFSSGFAALSAADASRVYLRLQGSTP